jgi:hypothetical protein
MKPKPKSSPAPEKSGGKPRREERDGIRRRIWLWLIAALLLTTFLAAECAMLLE